MPRRGSAVPADAAAVIAARRLCAQQIARPTHDDPGELVAFMGALQAQEPLAARWALAVRLAGRAGTATVDAALADGRVVRTHALRWTWQLVVPADLHWLLPLVAPRLVARAARRHRELDLDAATFRRAHALIERALGDGVHRTREELGAALRGGGVAVTGPRLSHILGHAELAGLICSGTPRAGRATYVLVGVRTSRRGGPSTRTEAAAELARRYFASRGPATAADFAWWSGLAPAEARGALEAVRGELVNEPIGGAVYWWGARAARATKADLARAYLLPAFDEYLIAYRDRDAVLSPDDARRINAGGGLLAPIIVVGGRAVGTWRRTFERRGTVTLALAPFEPLSSAQRDATAEAAARYAAFLGLEPTLLWRRPLRAA